MEMSVDAFGGEEVLSPGLGAGVTTRLNTSLRFRFGVFSVTF
jgi:hypothetical protein